jgi:hypothetical protein
MKFKITMKDPDGFYDCLADAARDAADQVTGLDDDERDALIDTKKEKLSELLSKWFQYSEYLTVEVDTEAQTCVVVPN